MAVIAFSVIIWGCSDNSETELKIYLLEEKILSGKKKAMISVLEPRTFEIWKNTNSVYQEEVGFDGIINKRFFNRSCLVESKNNWCCYGTWENNSNLYEYHLETPRFIIQNDWIRDKNAKELVCHSGVLNGKWMLQVKYYEDNSDTFRSTIYSVPYWKWLLYKFNILSNE